ncbi:flagellin [Magnetococcus sp. PR-3]|uniref:flagellin n=1 Tax=Magnetococcus sp. PR-3 TaxID=3120355 RepID=UPI002FCE528E
MPITINDSLFAAQQSSNQLLKVKNESENSFEALASGLKINQAVDNPGLMGMISRLTSEVRGINTARQNINQGVSLTQVAQTGVDTISNDVQRLRELAVQSANGTLNDSDRSAINAEATEIQQSIADTISNTTFNGQSLLDSGNSVTIQSGTDANNQTDLQLSDLSSLNSAGSIDLSTQAGAEASLSLLDSDLDSLGTLNASFGAYQNSLESAADNISQMAINTEAARAQVQDANVAAEMARQTGSAIRMQSIIAVQAQASQITDNLYGKLIG